MEQTGHRRPFFWNIQDFGKDKPINPVVGVSQDDSEEFCDWQAMQLPTEAEWEYAARGPQGFTFPWGNIWAPSRIDFKIKHSTQPVNAHTTAASPFGIMDMAGNIWQRTFDGIVLRGGSWHTDDPIFMRGACRFFDNLMSCDNAIGFRVGKDITPKGPATVCTSIWLP